MLVSSAQLSSCEKNMKGRKSGEGGRQDVIDGNTRRIDKYRQGNLIDAS